ncbi:hypothetical protein Drorol1_Dr00021692, partial [Drosera rotundifolia]
RHEGTPKQIFAVFRVLDGEADLASPFSLLTWQRRTPYRRWTSTVTAVLGVRGKLGGGTGLGCGNGQQRRVEHGGAALGGFDDVQRRQQAGKRAAGSAALISRVSIM